MFLACSSIVTSSSIAADAVITTFLSITKLDLSSLTRDFRCSEKIRYLPIFIFYPIPVSSLKLMYYKTFIFIFNPRIKKVLRYKWLRSRILNQSRLRKLLKVRSIIISCQYFLQFRIILHRDGLAPVLSALKKDQPGDCGLVRKYCCRDCERVSSPEIYKTALPVHLKYKQIGNASPGL